MYFQEKMTLKTITIIFSNTVYLISVLRQKYKI
jgi:hypothetical protein